MKHKLAVLAALGALVALAVGVLVCVVVGAGGYLLVIQPFLERNSTLGWVGANLALAFALNTVLLLRLG